MQRPGRWMLASSPERSLVGPVVFGLMTLAAYSVLRALQVVPRVEPWDRALLISLPIAATGLMLLLRVVSRGSDPPSLEPAEPRIAPPPPPSPPRSTVPPPPPPRASTDAPTADALLRFARELNASPEIDRLHQSISRGLAPLLGYQDVWVITRSGRRQQVIVPDSGRRAAGMLGSVQQWMTFPLSVEGTTFGLLGVGVGQERMSEGRRRVVSDVASLIAQAMKTSDAFERMREASTVDPLTGCSTRADGLRRLDIELRRAQRSDKPAGILMLDLDHFKSVNDRFGHPGGDAVLAQVGRTLMETLRASDIRCRWGGEEFLIVLPETGLEAAKRVAEAIRRRIAEEATAYGGEEIRVTASVGASVTRPAEVATQNLLLRVDAALYRAKHDGRNCVRAVIGDLRGVPVGTPPGGPILPFPDRRDPSRPDRRRIAGFGRRRTDRT